MLTTGFDSLAGPGPKKPFADTTEKLASLRNMSKDSALYYSNYLLNNNPIFMDHWDNNILFPFSDFKYDDIPENIVLPMSGPNDKFTMTWYGMINSTYKMRWGRQHHGLDINLKTGDTVLSAFNGVVRFAQYTTAGFGNCVIIRHMNGLETIYGHLSKKIGRAHV